MLDFEKVYKKHLDSIKKDRDDKNSNDNIRWRKQQLKQFMKDTSDFCRSLCEIKFSIINKQ